MYEIITQGLWNHISLLTTFRYYGFVGGKCFVAYENEVNAIFVFP